MIKVEWLAAGVRTNPKQHIGLVNVQRGRLSICTLVQPMGTEGLLS
jgi:hypothetical protein